MTGFPPFVNATGVLKSILVKISSAAQPPKFSQDYLETVLGFSGGSANAAVPFLKRMGFLNQDGTPTELYSKFRNDQTRGMAMAAALRHGYAEVFKRNEYAYKMSDDQFKNLIVEMTGCEKANASLKSVLTTWNVLKSFADFEASSEKALVPYEGKSKDMPDIDDRDAEKMVRKSIGLSYNINLILPESKDIQVFDTIFKSLKAHLLDE